MTIVFDLDNTICVTDEESPLSVRYTNCIVKPRIRDLINRLYKKGHTIYIDTARASSHKGIKGIYMRWFITRLTKKQLKEWNISYHKLRVGVKLPADLYIDDKSIHPKVFESGK